MNGFFATYRKYVLLYVDRELPMIADGHQHLFYPVGNNTLQ